MPSGKRIFFWLCIFFGWGFIFWGISLLIYESFYFSIYGVPANAEIVELRNKNTGEKHVKNYHYTIYYEDVTEKINYPVKLNIGDTIPILYDPKDKHNLMIGKEEDSPFQLIRHRLGNVTPYLGILVALFLCFGIWEWYFKKRKRNQ